MSDLDPIPVGYCQCGWGQRTNLAPQSHTKMGWVRGEPLRYVKSHGNRKRQKYVVEDRGYQTHCWIWQLWRTDEGYGKFSINRGGGRVESQLAHRWVWEQENGPVPEGMHLDHLCRQPSCVRPDHLEPVSPAENARRSRSAKLDWPKVRDIRRRLKEGTTFRELAEEHGVSLATISHIASGRNWRES